MKTTIVALAAMCTLTTTAHAGKGDVATDAYPEAQAQIKKRLAEIWATIASKDLVKQESFHLYGPKFTEFKDGLPRGNAEANRKEEREIIGVLVDPKVEMKDLAVAVYGDTAIATFNGDFSGKIGGKPVAMKQASTMVFVKHKGDWKRSGCVCFGRRL